MSQYYDIDDILAEDELVPAVFQVSANGVGLFDSSDETNKIEQGSKVKLPFWLARELHLRQAVLLSLPPCFNKRTRDELAADAAHVDLKSRCPFFYELGRKLFSLDMRGRVECSCVAALWVVSYEIEKAEIINSIEKHQFNYLRDEVGDKTIGTLLLAAFQTRYKEVLIKSQTAALTVAPKFLKILTKEETKLYEAAQSSMVAFKKWRMGGPRFLKASVLGRKRRSSD